MYMCICINVQTSDKFKEKPLKKIPTIGHKGSLNGLPLQSPDLTSVEDLYVQAVHGGPTPYKETVCWFMYIYVPLCFILSLSFRALSCF